MPIYSAYCTWRDGSNLSPYQDGSNAVSNMNCRKKYKSFPPPTLRHIINTICFIADCARDVKIFATEGFQLPLSCTSNGNYALLQDLDGESFCVDQDGFVVSPTFTEPIRQDDCNKYVYYLL